MTGMADWMIKTCFISNGICVWLTITIINSGATTKRPKRTKTLSLLKRRRDSPAFATEIPIKIIDSGIVRLPKY